MKLYDPDKEKMDEMELNKASIEVLVASLGSRAHKWGMAEAKYLPEAEQFKSETKQIAQELLSRDFVDISVSDLTFQRGIKYVKFYE
jgi:hypothetical protein